MEVVQAKSQLFLKLKEENTFIKKAIDEFNPDAHSVHLKVGVQSFNVTPADCETKEHAEWFRDRLAEALEALVSQNGVV